MNPAPTSLLRFCRTVQLAAAVIAATAVIGCAVPHSPRATEPTADRPRTTTPAPEPPRPQRGPTAEEAARNRARPYVDGMKALERYRATTGCENAETGEILASIAELEDNVRSFHTVGLTQYERDARAKHTSLAFDFAEECLERGCLDNADQVYRRIIEFYVGNAYSGIRDRARLGIDDIRFRRSRSQAPTSLRDSAAPRLETQPGAPQRSHTLLRKPNARVREPIGTWLDERPAFTNQILIYRLNGNLYMERKFKDGSEVKRELVEGSSSKGRRFEEKGGSRFGEYYVIDRGGRLQMWDREGLIATARKLQ